MELVTVVIVNWNGKRFLKECLEALRNQTFQNFSVIVVDNGSTDGSARFVAQNYPEVKVVCFSDNIGFSAANNAVINNLRTEYVALLNNDTVPDCSWLGELIKALEEHCEAGIAASKMCFFDRPEVIDRAGDAYTKAGAGLLRGRGVEANAYGSEEWIFGACAGAALYRTRMFMEIGLFDEDFFLLNEDIDLCFRAQLSGYKCIYQPRAIVYHKASASIVYDSYVSIYYGHRNLEWVYIKNMPSSIILKSILLHFVYDIAAFFYFLSTGQVKVFLKSKIDALRGLKKMLEKRHKIQQSKVVSDDYIWSLFENELVFPRLTRRLKAGKSDSSQ